jgi:hypothetical protein
MHGRVCTVVIACLLSLCAAGRAGAQLIPSVTPAFDPPARPTFSSRAPSLFEASQIVDRPTADLRPRFHWGIFGSVVPNWTIPGSMGNWFFEDQNSPKMSGRDLRIGVVRGRQLGFELGVAFVRKTVTSLDIRYGDPTNSGQFGSLAYSAPNNVHMTGADAHLIFPLARLGERVQLGILAGGGMAWLPDTPIQLRIEGPPFYADANSTVALPNPPAGGGFVRQSSFFPVGEQAIPVVPGTRYGLTGAVLYDISPTDHYWMLLRGQLAADFLVASSLKLRVAGGFNYPGMQAIGIDGIYLFRTGRVGTTPAQPTPGAAPAPGAQIADQPQIIAPRRSYWGVLGGVTPKWWTPESWGPIFEPDDPDIVEGREFRIGITRGRPLGYEFGVSFVMKSLTEFVFNRDGASVFLGGPTGIDFNAPLAARVTLSRIDPVKAPGVEFHSFIPMGRIGQRVLIGGLLGAGIAHVPKDPILKRVDGPPFVASATSNVGLTTLPPGGGFVFDDTGQAIPLAPGQTGAVVPADATTISPLESILILARGQIAADVLLAAPFKLRFSGGFNYPGAQLFGIEAVYLFGTGR